MNYKKKRQKAGIEFSTMVEKLNIPEEKYKEVEQGKRRLEGQMLDKFMSIINNKKQVKLEETIKMNEINKFFEDGTAQKRMVEYGYKRQKDLAKAMKIAQATVSVLFRGKGSVSDDMKIKVYNWLNNPLNKNILASTEKPVKTPKNDVKKHNIILKKPSFKKEWVYNHLKESMEQNGVSQSELSKAIGCNCSTINKFLKNVNGLGEGYCEKIYDYFNKKLADKKEEKIEIKNDISLSRIEKNNDKLIKKDNSDKISTDKNNLEEEIIKLKKQIERYEKLIDLL